MRIGVSVFLVAVGAVLAFAVEYDVAGLDIAVVGWILMVVGVIGGVLSWMALRPWASRRGTVAGQSVPLEREIIRER